MEGYNYVISLRGHERGAGLVRGFGIQKGAFNHSLKMLSACRTGLAHLQLFSTHVYTLCKL